MLHEVCYRALLSVSVVEATHGRVLARVGVTGVYARTPAVRRSPGYTARSSIFRFHPQDSLAGGPPPRWFVILYMYTTDHQDVFVLSVVKIHATQKYCIARTTPLDTVWARATVRESGHYRVACKRVV